jgi:peptidyl-prolyl cis-trans isomerase B (cyclophilin B)
VSPHRRLDDDAARRQRGDPARDDHVRLHQASPGRPVQGAPPSSKTHCHRLTIQGIFVLQCGDPTGTGSGGPGYNFNDENLAGATHPAGTVAMANAGPNTKGSQFFITWKDTVLSPAYTPFGKVTSGLAVLQKIAAGGDDDQNGPGDGYPKLYVGIRHVTVG